MDHQHPEVTIPELRVFDPRDKDDLLALDAWACATGETVFPVIAPPQCHWQYPTFGPDTEMRDWPDWYLASWLQATRDCPKWGISYDMISVADQALGWFDYEARRRVQMAEKRQRIAKAGYPSWTDYPLLEAVESVCGAGRKSGKEVWFRCPFHEDSSPSLEVNPSLKVWHCWGCDAKGGVVEWRKRMERA